MSMNYIEQIEFNCLQEQQRQVLLSSRIRTNDKIYNCISEWDDVVTLQIIVYSNYNVE